MLVNVKSYKLAVRISDLWLVIFFLSSEWHKYHTRDENRHFSRVYVMFGAYSPDQAREEKKPMLPDGSFRDNLVKPRKTRNELIRYG